MALNWLKKLFSKWKQPEDPPFIVVKKSGIKLNDNDKIDIQLICPMCQTHWADATVRLGASVAPEDFRVKELFASTKIDPNKVVQCPACQHLYTKREVLDLVHTGLIQKQIEEIDDDKLLGNESEAVEPEGKAPDKSTSNG